MSPRRSSSMVTSCETDRDVVMHLPDAFSPSSAKTTDKVLVEKYRSLKRRYHELEEQNHDESSMGLERSEERNAKRHEEQSRIKDSISLLEKEHPGIHDLSGSSLLQSISAVVPQNSVDEHDNGAGNDAQTTDSSELSFGKGARTLRNRTPRNRGSLQGHVSSSFSSSSVIVPSSSPKEVPNSPSRLSSSTHTSSAIQKLIDANQPPAINGSSLASSPAAIPNDPNGQLGRESVEGETTVNRSRAPAPGPLRSTRRSSRLISAEHEPVGDGAEPGPGPRTRGAAKRVVNSPAGKTQPLAISATAVGNLTQEKSVASPDGISPAFSSTEQLVAQSSTPNPPASDETLPSDPNIDPFLVSSASNGLEQSSKEFSPMENIVKVAEAAIAAQNAVNSQTVSPGQSPSFSDPSKTSQTMPSSSTSSSSSTSTSYNPYMALVPGKLNTSGVPLPLNPYSVYYAPGTPITPGASPYSPYGNPYYYLTTPLGAPSGGFPSSPNGAQPNTQRPSPDPQRPVKPKRLKAHTVTSKSFSIPMVPRDRRGKPMLPLNVGIMTVISLGDVCMREHFHTERYIFPVGYEVTRRYLSTVDPNIEVVYHCTILDGGDGPKFQIVPSDVPGRPVIAGTATGAWSSIVKQANAIRNRQHSNSVSGPDFFGLGQNTIKHLIQELPNADRLRDYVWQTFIEGGPLGGRHAAVIPALPEEYDSSMPIGAYYPTQSERERRAREAGGVPDSPRDISGNSHYPRHVHLQAERHKHQTTQQLGELSASGQQPATQTQAPSQIETSLMNLQEFRPQLATSADRTRPQVPDGLHTETNIQSGTVPTPAPTPTQ
ncbi:hypothetical protein H2248_007152 [Termitomyces sp. 'cryptogamus']|nr:hypothetical protein H2248_007152 [Termitomyces sp. 'cryptogamus']